MAVYDQEKRLENHGWLLAQMTIGEGQPGFTIADPLVLHGASSNHYIAFIKLIYDRVLKSEMTIDQFCEYIRASR